MTQPTLSQATASAPTHRAEIRVDLAAIRANIAAARERLQQDLLVVVKADGYGHGMTTVAQAARAAGVGWLGVASLEEAVQLRQAGDAGRILSWLHVPGEDFEQAADLDIDVTAYSVEEIAEMAAVNRGLRVQLKADTGLSRGGATASAWPALVAAAAAAERAGQIRVTGICSHFASADQPGDPLNQTQAERFTRAVAEARQAGLQPEVVHIANSAGATLIAPHPDCNLVRLGILTYGLTPDGGPSPLPVRAAMTVRARLAVVKEIEAGEGVSYGHTFVAPRPMRTGLVPVGYGDGIPRHASNRAEVWVNGHRCRILGRVCMDQFVIDLSDVVAERGDEVILFGPGDRGEPTAQDWARAAETINYEIVTRIGGRMHRVYDD